jgi:hypothetical protein
VRWLVRDGADGPDCRKVQQWLVLPRVVRAREETLPAERDVHSAMMLPFQDQS